MELYNILLILLAVEFLVLLLYVRKGVNTMYATKLAILNLNNGLSILVHIARDNQRPGTDKVYQVQDEQREKEAEIQQSPEPEPEPEEKKRKYVHYLDHIRKNKLLTPGTVRNSTFQDQIPIGFIARHTGAGERCYAVVVDLLGKNETDPPSFHYKLRVLSEDDHRNKAVEGVSGTNYLRFTDGRSETIQKFYRQGLSEEEAFAKAGLDLSKPW